MFVTSAISHDEGPCHDGARRADDDGHRRQDEDARVAREVREPVRVPRSLLHRALTRRSVVEAGSAAGTAPSSS